MLHCVGLPQKRGAVVAPATLQEHGHRAPCAQVDLRRKGNSCSAASQNEAALRCYAYYVPLYTYIILKYILCILYLNNHIWAAKSRLGNAFQFQTQAGKKASQRVRNTKHYVANKMADIYG